MDKRDWLGLEGKSSQTIRTHARRLAAYVPMTVTRQILRGEQPSPGTAVWLNVATLFSDISGFTRMAEALAVDGPRGAEELNQALLITFTGLINTIHDAGGEVAHFYGDAMLVYFTDEDGRAAARALACASFMQRLMHTSLAHMTPSPPIDVPEAFELGIKIGVGYGRCLQAIVGQLGESLEFVLAGMAVDEAVTAQQEASPGQVIASQTVLTRVGLPGAEPFRPVEAAAPVPHAREELHWHAYDVTDLARLLEVAPAFVPPALYDRLQHQTTRFIAEHRSVTTFFVQFEGIDLNAPDAGEKLQVYYEWARAVVARFGPRNGRVNRLLTGDKGNQLHILFGAPVAPDAPEQAIRCALALQHEKPPFITGQRIGLALGPVFATAVGAQNRREYTAVGRVVNLSAHLTGLCPVGSVLVDAHAANRAWAQFHFQSLSPVLLKGHTEPVPVYQVMEEQVTPTQFAARFARWHRPPPGREEELAQLQQRLQQALHGQGGVVVLSGPFGGGVRPLLATAVRAWLAAGGRGASGTCQPHTSDVPFAPWQAIWADFFGLSPDMASQARAEAVTARVRDLAPAWADEAALWLAAMGLPVAEREAAVAQVVAVGVRQLWLFSLVQRCLAQAARSRPLLILLEDVQWADEASLELLSEVAAAAGELPLLLLLTFRPVAPFYLPLLNASASLHIPLTDWTAAQARTVVQRRLGTGELPPLVEQRLGLRDAHGREADQVNPLYLEESLKMMLSLDVLQFEATGNGRVRVDEARLAQLPIPDTIAALLQTRLDALPAEAYTLLQVAAVIGREFALTLLVDVAPGLTAAAALARLHELVAAELVQTIAAGPEPVFMFQHTLLQEVAYRSLPYARRQALHLAVAEKLAARQPEHRAIYALLAHHYGQADEHEAGLRYALAAAQDAAAVNANRAAVDLYRQALRHLQAVGVTGRADTAVTILMAQAQACFLMGELEEAAKAVASALEFCDASADKTAWLTAVNLLAEIGVAQCRYREAATLTQQALTQTTPHTAPTITARAAYLAGWAAAGHSHLSQAEAYLRQARVVAKTSRQIGLLPAVLAALGWVRCRQGAWRHGAELCQQAIDVAQQHELALPAAEAMRLLAQVRLRQGRAREAVQTVTEAAELTRAAAPRLLAHLLILRAVALVYDGRFPEALADLKQAESLLGMMDDTSGRLRLYLAWSRYCTGLADWAAALGRLDQAREQLALLGKMGGTAVSESIGLRVGLAQIALHTRQWSQAASLLAAAQGEVTASGLTWWQPAVAYWQGMVHVAVADETAAKLAYRQALMAVTRGGNPDDLPLILLRLGQLTPAEDARHWEYLERCVTAVYDRVRYADKLVCLQEAGALLVHAPDGRLRRIGAGCLAALPRHA